MKSNTVMTWTPDSIETWRDSSVLFGHNFETNHYFDRDSIHARRDMIVLFGQFFLTTRYFDRDSIHARRDMSVEKPPVLRATHDDDLDTTLDSRLAGYERHIQSKF